MRGTADDDVLTVTSHQLRLNLGKGSDKATGNALDNTILGGVGADALRGVGGADRLIGGAGRDLLIGGADADTFVYLNARDSGHRPRADQIADFTHDLDRMDDLVGSWRRG